MRGRAAESIRSRRPAVGLEARLWSQSRTMMGAARAIADWYGAMYPSRRVAPLPPAAREARRHAGWNLPWLRGAVQFGPSRRGDCRPLAAARETSGA